MKKIIAIALVVVLLASIIAITPFGDEQTASAPLLSLHDAMAAERSFLNAEQSISAHSRNIDHLSIEEALSRQAIRDGYVLAPTAFSLTGVDPLSLFVLRTPPAYDFATPQLSIDGQQMPQITREDSNTFMVTPAVPLMANSVYVFRLAGDGGDITWAFQTARQFEIVSTMPRHQATNVPVRTGIEISFSFGAQIDISEYFNIHPPVEGRFVHRESTVAFLPTDPLAYAQVYTVTVAAGAGLANSTDYITREYVFAFETAPETPVDWGRFSDVNFFDRHVEFPSFAPPTVQFWLNRDRPGQRPDVYMSVYRVEDRAQAIAAIDRLSERVNWSMLPRDDEYIDVSGLNSIYSRRFDAAEDPSRGWGESFTLSRNLVPGFYVLNAAVNGHNSQVIIQITDLAVQLIGDDDKTIVWVNCMQTGLPAAGASVLDVLSNRRVETGAYGIAVVERKLNSGDRLIVTAADGKETVVFVNTFAMQWFRGGSFTIWEDDWGRGGGFWGGGGNAHSEYWSVLHLDRTLFQRSDTLSLWGFIQNRRQHEEIRHLTVEISEHAWWSSRWPAPAQDTLLRQSLAVENGSFSGEIRLPHLSPGFYELVIFHGDMVLRSTFFSVMDFVKPPYQLEVSVDKLAVFAGDEIKFRASVAFFEGTPVPDLSISYSSWGWELQTLRGRSVTTDENGLIEISVTPTASTAAAQGERHLFITAETTLPEIGWTHEELSVRVFINDIKMDARAIREGANATLSLNIHGITLDRLNDGTAISWDDYLCAPVAGQNVSVEIVEIYWESIRQGERYCHVTRQVVPRYRHVERIRVVDRFELSTNTEGYVSRDFQIPNRDNASYQARLSTVDGNGRTINQNVFIGHDFSSFFWHADMEAMFLDGANEEGYDIGDAVRLTVMSGADAVTVGNFLFVVVHDGIISYHIGVNPLEFVFEEHHVPNVQVFAFHFNGHTYSRGGMMSQRLRFNPESRALNVAVSFDRDLYRPGETVNITINTSDVSGRPVPANVNLSIVDEALFALMDNYVSTLAMLYGNVNDNLRLSIASHRLFISDGIVYEDQDDALWAETNESEATAFLGEMPVGVAQAYGLQADSAGRAGAAGAQARVRERFEDTATFVSLRTNAQGVLNFSFRLPDNITSWRVTASAISNDLYAGNDVSFIRVTQPMFLHYNLNDIFLLGDRAYVGVSAFGTALSGGERVDFEVWRENAPLDIRRASGVAFERVDISLWDKSEEGSGAIIIRATAGGYSDALRHDYQVVSSHRMMDIMHFYNVDTNTEFTVNPYGMTNIVFTDAGSGQFLGELLRLRNTWRTGARVEGYIARREANRLIRAHFPETGIFDSIDGFNILEYQQDSGGISILPHADADLLTTVTLLPFIRDEINLPALRDYLNDILNDSATDNRILAMYGLAKLGEPVLMQLQRYAMLEELSLRNTAYIALAFAALGETHTARELYISRLLPNIQSVGAYYRVNVGANRLEILDATSIASLLAAQLGMPESLGLHNYSIRHRPSTLLNNIERLTFIEHAIPMHDGQLASVTYRLFGEEVTRELGRGQSFTLRIPALSMHEFSLQSISGEVSAVSIVRVPLEEIERVDTGITVRREFFRAGTNISTTSFEQGELVRVQITIDYSTIAMTGSFVITDFLPAGLVHVSGSARFGDMRHTPGWWTHVMTEGQRVSFFDFNRSFGRVNVYYYYARVVNAGTFLAEGTIVQNMSASEYITIGQDVTVTIR